MKRILNNLFDQYLLCCLLTNAFNLFILIVGISIGASESLRESLRGISGGEILFIMFGLPLIWAVIMLWFYRAIDSLYSK